jgi:hypothetical protein
VAALLEVFQEGALDRQVEMLSRLKLTSLRIRGKDLTGHSEVTRSHTIYNSGE